MNKFTDYIILREIDLVIEYYRGQIVMDDVINLKKKVFNDNNYHSEIKIIMDFRHADTKIDNADLLKYLEFIKDNITLIGDRRVAFLTSHPNHVAYGILFELMKNKPMKTEVFSTLEAAIYWLNVDINSLIKIENSIVNLSRNSHNI